MKYFLRVFCPNGSPLSPDEIVDFIKDGFFFDDEPGITVHKEDDLNWSIKIVYDHKKDPVIISRSVNDKESQKEIDEIKFVLNVSKESKEKHLILDLISKSVMAYTLQINQEEITDDCWEMLDSIEAKLMKSCNGILFTGDNEFFDQGLKKIYKL